MTVLHAKGFKFQEATVPRIKSSKEWKEYSLIKSEKAR